MMKFLGKYTFMAGVVWAVTILWLTVDKAPDYFYIKYLITCIAAYILVNTLGKVIYFICAKIKSDKA